MPPPSEATPSTVADAAAAHATASPAGSSRPPVWRIYSSGPASYLNLSVYAIGLTGLWSALGSVILPLLVSDIVENGPIHVLWMDLQKNGAMSLIATAGGIVVGATQPIAGFISDRTSSRLGKRLPYIIVGTLGLVPLVLIIGVANSLFAITILWCLMQLFGNIAQGPANALLVDHVPPDHRGSASGVLILSRAIGGGIVTAIVLAFMRSYDADTGQAWLWASLVLVAISLAVTAAWTLGALRPRRGLLPTRHVDLPTTPLSESTPEPAHADAMLLHNSKDSFTIFLIALALIIAGMSAMPMYALFYMEDMVGQDNPSQAMLIAVAVVAPVIALTVIPAGRLSDRLGRGRVLTMAGIVGGAGVLVLAFVPQLPIVVLAGVPIGISVGVFFTVMWALANDLVATRSAGRDLGFTGIAFLAGAGIARLSGFGIDSLNDRSENLGYQVLLLGIAISFVGIPVVINRFSTAAASRRRPG